MLVELNGDDVVAAAATAMKQVHTAETRIALRLLWLFRCRIFQSEGAATAAFCLVAGLRRRTQPMGNRDIPRMRYPCVSQKGRSKTLRSRDVRPQRNRAKCQLGSESGRITERKGIVHEENAGMRGHGTFFAARGPRIIQSCFS